MSSQQSLEQSSVRRRQLVMRISLNDNSFASIVEDILKSYPESDSETIFDISIVLESIVKVAKEKIVEGDKSVKILYQHEYIKDPLEFEDTDCKLLQPPKGFYEKGAEFEFNTFNHTGLFYLLVFKEILNQ